MPLISQIGRKQFKVRLLILGITAFLWTGVLLHIFPLWWMISTSFKTTAEIFTNPIGLFPAHFSLASYRLLFGTLAGAAGESLFRYPLTIYIKNSFVIAIGEIIIQVPVVIGLAYACSRLHTARMKKAIFYFAIATMMLPGTVKMVPNFLLLTHFPWPTETVPSIPFTGIHLPSVSFVGSFFGVILPGMFSGFNFLIMKSFFDGIDKEYIEAARIDGCSELGIVTQIVLPLARPVIAYVCYTTFCSGWNNFMGPWIMLQNEPDKWPLSVILMQLNNFLTSTSAVAATNEVGEALRASGAGYNALMAIALIESIPILLLFIFFREQIMKGVKLQGLKG